MDATLRVLVGYGYISRSPARDPHATEASRIEHDGSREGRLSPPAVFACFPAVMAHNGRDVDDGAIAPAWHLDDVSN